MNLVNVGVAIGVILVVLKAIRVMRRPKAKPPVIKAYAPDPLIQGWINENSRHVRLGSQKKPAPDLYEFRTK